MYAGRRLSFVTTVGALLLSTLASPARAEDVPALTVQDHLNTVGAVAFEYLAGQDAWDPVELSQLQESEAALASTALPTSTRQWLQQVEAIDSIVIAGGTLTPAQREQTLYMGAALSVACVGDSCPDPAPGVPSPILETPYCVGCPAPAVTDAPLPNPMNLNSWTPLVTMPPFVDPKPSLDAAVAAQAATDDLTCTPTLEALSIALQDPCGSRGSKRYCTAVAYPPRVTDTTRPYITGYGEGYFTCTFSTKHVLGSVYLQHKRDANGNTLTLGQSADCLRPTYDCPASGTIRVNYSHYVPCDTWYDDNWITIMQGSYLATNGRRVMIYVPSHSNGHEGAVNYC